MFKRNKHLCFECFFSAAEVLVLFDYDAQADDELTIRKGKVSF